MAGQTQSPTRSIRNCGSSVLTRTVYPPLHRIESHVHNAGCFGITLHGLLRESFGGATVERIPRTVFYRPPQSRHANLVGEDEATCFVLEFGTEWTARVNEHGSLPDRPTLFGDGRMNRIMHDMYRESQLADAASSLAIEALQLELAANTLRESRNSGTQRGIQSWLLRIKQRLDDSFRENLSLSELAKDAGVHPVHVAREFRCAFSITVGEYVRRRRIDAAMADMQDSDRPIASIALQAGFSSQAHFTKVFRQISGKTPGEYRQANAKHV